MPKFVTIAYNIVGCSRFYIFIFWLNLLVDYQHLSNITKLKGKKIVLHLLWFIKLVKCYETLCMTYYKYVEEVQNNHISHNSNDYSLPLLPNYVSTMCIGQITFWNVHFYFQICTYLKRVEIFNFLGKEMLYFFWTFRHIKRTFWKFSTLFGTQWQTRPTSCWQAPSQAQWQRELSLGTTKGLKPTTVYDTLGFQTRDYTTEPSQLSHTHGNIITTLHKSCWFHDTKTNIRPALQ